MSAGDEELDGFPIETPEMQVRRVAVVQSLDEFASEADAQTPTVAAASIGAMGDSLLPSARWSGTFAWASAAVVLLALSAAWAGWLSGGAAVPPVAKGKTVARLAEDQDERRESIRPLLGISLAERTNGLTARPQLLPSRSPVAAIPATAAVNVAARGAAPPDTHGPDTHRIVSTRFATPAPRPTKPAETLLASASAPQRPLTIREFVALPSRNAPVEGAPTPTATSVAATASKSTLAPATLPPAAATQTPPPPAAMAAVPVGTSGTPALATAGTAASSSTGAPVASAVTNQPNQEPAVRDVLAEFQAAYGRLDAAAAKHLWPSVDQRALAKAFDGLASQNLTFDTCRVHLGHATALAYCSGQTRFVGRYGSREQSKQMQWTFSLERAGAGWQIQTVEIR